MRKDIFLDLTFDHRPETKDNTSLIYFIIDNRYGLVGADPKSGINYLTIIRIAWNLLDYLIRQSANKRNAEIHVSPNQWETNWLSVSNRLWSSFESTILMLKIFQFSLFFD